MNDSLLKDQIFVTEVKTIIEETKTNYISRIENYSSFSVNEIPIKDRQLNIDDQLLLDVLLMTIRAKTIAYSSIKRKIRKKNREDVGRRN